MPWTSWMRREIVTDRSASKMMARHSSHCTIIRARSSGNHNGDKLLPILVVTKLNPRRADRLPLAVRPVGVSTAKFKWIERRLS
jgi:hypothetical protein